MHSENIDALHEALGQYVDTGVVFEPEAIREICAMLVSIGEDARRLEAIIAGARNLPADVVDLVVHRSRRDSIVTAIPDGAA